jgi:AcrR family transcriptional regulator
MDAVKDVFWDRGYEGATIGDIEARAGVNRSSLYHAYGDKRGLYSAALDHYVRCFIDPLLGIIETPRAGLDAILAFFSALKRSIQQGPSSGSRGCLLVNTIAESAGREGEGTERGIWYRDRLRMAFAHALRGDGGQGQTDEISRRARLLAAATFGIWLSARIDPGDATELCEEIMAEVRSWKSSPADIRPGR